MIPRFRRFDPGSGRGVGEADPTVLARRWDDLGAPAIAVSTSALYRGSPGDLKMVSTAVDTAVFCDSPCLDADQIYGMRIGGADAVLLPADRLGFEELRELAALATSMHMTPVVEVVRAIDVEIADRIPMACIGITLPGATREAADVLVRDWTAQLSPRRVAVLLEEVVDWRDGSRLCGAVDAICCTEAALQADRTGVLESVFAGEN